MKKILSVVAALIVLCSGARVFAQDSVEAPPSLRNLLITRYKLTKTVYDTVGGNGTQVIEAGPVFVIKKGGLLGVVPQGTPTCGANFKGGDLEPASGKCRFLAGPTARLLDVGEKVYIIKLAVDTKNKKESSIDMELMECDSCNGVTQRSSFKSKVTFHFAPKYLDTAEPAQLADVIDQVLALDSQPAAQPQPAPTPAPASTPVAAPAPAAAEPPQIKKGDTPDQVKAILGPPDSTAAVGSRLVYIYKGLKITVTFESNKVTEIN